jgi:hypothetical protein
MQVALDNEGVFEMNDKAGYSAFSPDIAEPSSLIDSSIVVAAEPPQTVSLEDFQDSSRAVNSFQAGPSPTAIEELYRNNHRSISISTDIAMESFTPTRGGGMLYGQTPSPKSILRSLQTYTWGDPRNSIPSNTYFSPDK